ncbi:MAG: MBOAT family protein [Clostridia bacterium]|nr:MBOAT family protein [Clostridia bacterium]
MSVNGIGFLIFLAVCLAIYYAAPKKIRWLVLLTASIVFYLSFSVPAFLYLAVTVVSTYLFSLLLGKLAAIKPFGDTPEQKRSFKKRLTFKKRVVLSFALIINFATLAVLKYLGFFIANYNSIAEPLGAQTVTAPSLLLPLGISFYIFQTSGYLIDIYRGKCIPERNIAKYTLFVCYFPQMVQGPINRFKTLGTQLFEGNSFCLSNLQQGLLRMMMGVLKKALIADTLAKAVTSIYSDYNSYPGVIVFFGAMLYCIQLYCDFSGGIDLLNGASMLFGVKMEENFARPYFADSLSEFWRRWHISLGEWMKDYLFYPIALSKPMGRLTKNARKILPAGIVKRLTPCIATFVVFLAVGMWQGPGWANIAYGLWNGFWMSLALMCAPLLITAREKFPLKKKTLFFTVFGILRTNLLVIIGRYFSNSPTLSGALGMLKRTFMHPEFSQVSGDTFISLGITPTVAVTVLLSLACLFCISLAQEKGIDVIAWLCERKWYVQFTILFICLLIIIIGVYGNSGYTPIAYVYENV